MKNSVFSALLPSLDNLFIWINAIIMLAGIFVFDWKPEVVIIAYFLETIIIGIIHVFKLIIVLRFGDEQIHAEPDPKVGILGGVAAIPFFIFHYFFFIFVQSIFIFTMLANIVPSTNSSFNVFGNYAFLLAQHDVLIAFIALAFSNVALTLKDFIIPGEYRRTTISKLYFKPYVRIFIQQFVTILAMFFTMISSSAIAGAILIIAFRLIVDLFLQRASSNKEFKAKLIASLKKGQKPQDAQNTEESFDSFLEK
jgi:hypothetical protein